MTYCAEDYAKSETLSLRAQLALYLGHREAIAIDVAELRAHSREEIPAHYFVAIDSAMREEWRESGDEILEAGKLGLATATVQQFLDSGGPHPRACLALGSRVCLGSGRLAGPARTDDPRRLRPLTPHARSG